MPTTNVKHVLSPKYEYVKGKDAWRNNLHITAMAAERIRTSLGPNGAYKMVTYNRGPEKIIKITRDAVAVLEELAMQYPTLVVFSEAAKIQRQEIGDGVKTFVIFTAALLKKADELISKGVHPNIVLRGYKEAAKKTLEILNLHSQSLGSSQFDAVLDTIDCGRNCLNTELRQMLLETQTIATKEGTFDKDKVRIIRKPGASRTETELIKGLVIKKGKLHPNMPNTVEKPRIAITSESIGTNRFEVKMRGQGPFHLQFNISDPNDLAECRIAETNVNVLFSQQPIDDYSKSKLLKMGVLAFEGVDRKDLALISKATATRVVGPISELEQSDVGTAERLEIDKIDLEKTVTLTGCNFATFLIRGSNPQVLDELELLINNSMNLLEAVSISGRAVAGGGAIEMQVARNLKLFALQFSGKEQLAVDSFAEAMLEVPRCLAANNGLNPDDTMLQLRKLHAEGFTDYGINSEGCEDKACIDISEAKEAAVRRAFEVATLMLRIDEQITAKEIPKFHK
jgi:chaperonin GroEL (HSP60 family)